MGELFDFVFFNVRKYTGNIQTPIMMGNYDENIARGHCEVNRLMQIGVTSKVQGAQYG